MEGWGSFAITETPKRGTLRTLMRTRETRPTEKGHQPKIVIQDHRDSLTPESGWYLIFLSQSIIPLIVLSRNWRGRGDAGTVITWFSRRNGSSGTKDKIRIRQSQR